MSSKFAQLAEDVDLTLHLKGFGDKSYEDVPTEEPPPCLGCFSFVASLGFCGMFFSLRIAAYDRFLMILCYDVWISWSVPHSSKKGIGSDVTKLYGSLEVHSLNPNINELPATQVLRPSPQGTREWPEICSICLGVSEMFIFVDSFGIFSWKAWSWQDAKIRSIRLFLKGGTPVVYHQFSLSKLPSLYRGIPSVTQTQQVFL